MRRRVVDLYHQHGSRREKGGFARDVSALCRSVGPSCMRFWGSPETGNGGWEVVATWSWCYRSLV